MPNHHLFLRHFSVANTDHAWASSYQINRDDQRRARAGVVDLAQTNASEMTPEMAVGVKKITEITGVGPKT